MGGNNTTHKCGNPHHRPKHHRKLHRNSVWGIFRGLENENRFESAMDVRFSKPHWYCGWRRANGTEDHHESTDFWIETYFGDVRIDVKSSDNLAEVKERDLNHFRMEDVIVLVIHPHMNSYNIRSALFLKVEKFLRFKYGNRALQR